jgi:hypothetical protein
VKIRYCPVCEAEHIDTCYWEGHPAIAGLGSVFYVKVQIVADNPFGYEWADSFESSSRLAIERWLRAWRKDPLYLGCDISRV